MVISKKKLLGGLGTLTGAITLALGTAPALAASSFSNNLWQFASGNGASIIDFNKGGSGIWDNGDMHIATDNFMYLDATNRVSVSNALFVGSGPLVVNQTAQVDTLNALTTVHSNNTVTAGGGVSSDVTRAAGSLHSFQPIAGDLTYVSNAGGTGSFHAGVMGHFHGDTLTNSNSSYHAGVIGAYSVTTSDANTGPKAGVVGTVGVDNPTTVPDAGVMSVIDGDGGVITANAAYGVQYLNSTGGSHFSYGLDLSHAAAGYAAVTYGTADIRLSTGVVITSMAGPSGACSPNGSIALNSTASTASTVLYVCSTTWQAVTVP